MVKQLPEAVGNERLRELVAVVGMAGNRSRASGSGVVQMTLSQIGRAAPLHWDK